MTTQNRQRPIFRRAWEKLLRAEEKQARLVLHDILEQGDIVAEGKRTFILFSLDKDSFERLCMFGSMSSDLEPDLEV